MWYFCTNNEMFVLLTFVVSKLITTYIFFKVVHNDPIEYRR